MKYLPSGNLKKVSEDGSFAGKSQSIVLNFTHEGEQCFRDGDDDNLFLSRIRLTDGQSLVVNRK